MNKNIALAAAGLTAALIIGGTAYGASASTSSIPDSSGTIHGCYNKENGALRVIDPTTQQCLTPEIAIQWNQTGQQGPAGTAGVNGTNGNTILNGTGAPAGTAGQDGDFYLDTAADMLYGPKASGTWPATGTSLVGLPGTPGATGPPGPGQTWTTTPTLPQPGTYFVDVEAVFGPYTTPETASCGIGGEQNDPNPNDATGANVAGYESGEFSLVNNSTSNFSFSGMVTHLGLPGPDALAVICYDTNGKPLSPGEVQWWITPIATS
jgi:hypothetical protein